MNKRVLIFVGLVLIVCLVIFSLSFSDGTTQIDNKLLNGTIKGEVIKDNESSYVDDWKVDYNDTKNGVYYNFLMADSFNFTKEGFINLMDTEKIVEKDYNGTKWDIYYLNYHSSMSYDNQGFYFVAPGYICFASGVNGDYFVAVSSGAVNVNNSMDSDLFKYYLEPLLQNITLKDPSNPPKEYEILNSTKEDYDMVSSYVKQNGWETMKRSMVL